MADFASLNFRTFKKRIANNFFLDLNTNTFYEYSQVSGSSSYLSLYFQFKF
jgi:hypothetical protein